MNWSCLQEELHFWDSKGYDRIVMEHKAEKDMEKERIVDVKSAPEDAEVKASKPLYRRWKFRLCCGLGVGFVFLVGILFIILFFTVFKARDPIIWINGVRLADLNITYGTFIPHVQLKLDMNLTVHNPNRADYKYSNSSTIVFYQQIQVGHADIPAGQLGAGKTKTQIVTLNVQADKFLEGSNFTKDFVSGIIPVSATTRVRGEVNVLNIYKGHGVSYSWCNMSVFIVNQTLASFHCSYALHHG